MKLFLASLMSVLLAACVRTDTAVPTPEDPDWIRLEAPTGGEALDMAGNIDSVLFVGTMYKLYKTSDQGKSWELIWSGNTGPNAVLVRNDTLWHMMGILTSVKSANGVKTVRTINPREYSLDGGKTWKRQSPSYDDFGRQINSVSAMDGTIYSIKENSDQNGRVNPSEIIKKTGTSQGSIRFPFKHMINSVLLDAKNRLYVAVSGTHLPETNGIYCCPRDLPSVVYVSRRPMP